MLTEVAPALIDGWSSGQMRMAEQPAASVAEAPRGRGRVESYTVMHAGARPATICVIGDMVDGPDRGKRFIANMALTPHNLRLAFVDDLLGRVGAVRVATQPPIDLRTGQPVRVPIQ
jgi:hypothetical protein